MMMQVTLAERADVRQHTMWRYESGESLPGAAELDHIAAALGVSSTWLLWGDDVPDRGFAYEAELQEFLATSEGERVKEKPQELLVLRSYAGKLRPNSRVFHFMLQAYYSGATVPEMTAEAETTELAERELEARGGRKVKRRKPPQ